VCLDQEEGWRRKEGYEIKSGDVYCCDDNGMELSDAIVLL
jgi:hypothetical protein